MKDLVQNESFEIQQQYRGDEVDRRDERIVNERVGSRRGKRGAMLVFMATLEAASSYRTNSLARLTTYVFFSLPLLSHIQPC